MWSQEMHRAVEPGNHRAAELLNRLKLKLRSSQHRFGSPATIPSVSSPGYLNEVRNTVKAPGESSLQLGSLLVLK